MPMRYVLGVLALLMLLFAAVQYNDPDGPLWMLIYLVPALWAGVAAFRPRALHARAARVLLAATFAAALVGVAYYWPRSERWWSMEVWYEAETAREGMGMMVVALVLVIVWFATRRSSQQS